MLSSIFNTQHEFQSFTKVELQAASKSGIIDKRTFAIGNIGEKSIPILSSLGFGGAAVYGAVWNNFDFHQSRDFNELVSQFRRIKMLTD